MSLLLPKSWVSPCCALCHNQSPICPWYCQVQIPFLLCTERWLVPGTEYAVPEKLPLPRDWYTEREADVAAGMDGIPSHGTAGGTDVDESGECHCLCHLIMGLQKKLKDWGLGLNMHVPTGMLFVEEMK